MKKFILGCVLIFSGIAGGTGWLIAAAIIQGSGASPSLLEALANMENPLRRDAFVVIIFYIIAILGGILVAQNIRDEK